MLNGLLIGYFVLTAYQAIRHRQVGGNDWLLFGLGVGIFAGYGYCILILTGNGEGQLGGFSASSYWAFALITLAALLGDLRYLLAGELAGKGRLLRHFWRMLWPLLMATAAVFLGQAKLFPLALQQSGWLFVPVLTVLLVLVYWLARTMKQTGSHKDLQ